MCETSIDLAIKGSGGQKALAEKLKISVQAISCWKQTGRIPAERVLEVEKHSGVSRTVLRPDIYPAE